MPPLKSVLTFLAELLFRALSGRWFGQKTVDKGTYDAKAAEAKELAKPDDAQSAVVERL